MHLKDSYQQTALKPLKYSWVSNNGLIFAENLRIRNTI